MERQGGYPWKVSPERRREQISERDYTEFLTSNSLVSREYEDRKSGIGGGKGAGTLLKTPRSFLKIF